MSEYLDDMARKGKASIDKDYIKDMGFYAVDKEQVLAWLLGDCSKVHPVNAIQSQLYLAFTHHMNRN